MALERSSFFFRDKSPPAGTVFSARSTMAGTDFVAHARYFFYVTVDGEAEKERKQIESVIVEVEGNHFLCL